jgi:hypothetical protein
MRDLAKRSHTFGWRNNHDHPLDLILLPSISNGGSTLVADIDPQRMYIARSTHSSPNHSVE